MGDLLNTDVAAVFDYDYLFNTALTLSRVSKEPLSVFASPMANLLFAIINLWERSNGECVPRELASATTEVAEAYRVILKNYSSEDFFEDVAVSNT